MNHGRAVESGCLSDEPTAAVSGYVVALSRYTGSKFRVQLNQRSRDGALLQPSSWQVMTCDVI